MAYLTSALASHALFEKEGWADGQDLVSTVARVKFWLANKDLDLAAREVNSLTGECSLGYLAYQGSFLTRRLALFRAVCAGWPKALAADWLKQARQHLEVKQALDVSSGADPCSPVLSLTCCARTRTDCGARGDGREPQGDLRVRRPGLSSPHPVLSTYRPICATYGGGGGRSAKASNGSGGRGRSVDVLCAVTPGLGREEAGSSSLLAQT